MFNLYVINFFFFKPKTAYDMRIRDWSSDVCSSDLLLGVGGMGAVYRARDLLREQFGDPEPYVALKTLSEDFAEYPDASALLYSEYALTTRLSHRHVDRKSVV